MKEVTKIVLNGKPIGTKPLMLNDTLNCIRAKIKDRINEFVNYIFLDKEGNEIKNENENNLKLEDISNNKIIKIKEDNSQIKIILNESQLCILKCTPNQQLDELRKILMDKIKDDFLFLDADGNEVFKEDESSYELNDILKDNSLKIKSQDPSTRNFDFSKYEKIEEKEGLTLYKYSNLQRVTNHKLVYQYFYDKYDVEDYSNAYVVLFCGKTGDGKTTAINAFFNIIKGIKLQDNNRFLLILEPEKGKGQAESQTDGVHIYYLKDYDNKPVILIDSQGYGDTRGKEYDEMVDKAFQYVFSNIIDHINIVGFIVKSNTNRIDILTKYIFSSVTSLFSEDISENFLIIATYANKTTIEKGPDFVSSIKTDADFLKIEEKMNSDWWYAFDSKSILGNEKDKLTLYSYSKASELYEQKVKTLRKKGIKKCAEVLNTRMETKVEVVKLTDNFHKLIIEQDNLMKREKIIIENGETIEQMEYKIINLNRDMEKLDPKQLEEKMKNLNNEFTKMMNYLDNQTFYQTIKKLKYSDCLCTHCDNCEKNCHSICNCLFSSLGRCKIFTFFGKKCEECGCDKNKHKQDKYSYNFEDIQISKNNEKEKNEQINRKNTEENKLKQEINKKNLVKDELKRQKENLENKKEMLLKEKNSNMEEKNIIQKKIFEINHNIFLTIIKLHCLTDKINDIAMNNNHTKNEDDYIDDLLDKMDKMNIKDKDKIERIKKIKETNRIIKESLKLDKITLATMDDSQLSRALLNIIPNRI